MTPRLDQDAPSENPSVAHNVSTVPPERSILFNLLSAKNPTDWLSGDQKGEAAPSVPVTLRAASESRSRIHSIGLSFSAAVKANFLLGNRDIEGHERLDCRSFENENLRVISTFVP